MINSLIEVLNYSTQQIVKKKYGKNPDITINELLSALLYTNNTVEAAQKLGISSSTMARLIKQTLPASDGRTWHSFLRGLIGFKSCSNCNQDKLLEEFDCRSCVHDGRGSVCKTCLIDYRDNNRDSLRVSHQSYVAKNPIAVAERKKDYVTNNKARVYAKNAEYRARKLQASVPWANQEKIREVYATCPEGYEVDHIIPLQGELVCGLHVETNLQHLIAEENRSKGNKFTS